MHRYNWSGIIREIQETASLTQKEIGNRIGFTPAAISHVLTGKRSPGPRFKREIMKLARETGVDVSRYCEDVRNGT